MLRFCGRVVHLLAAPLRFVRHRPGSCLIAACIFVLAAGVWVYGYALQQWENARVALREDRPADARPALRFCLRVWPNNPKLHLLAARAARLTRDFEATETHLNRCLDLPDGKTTAVQVEFLLLRVQTGEVDDVARTLLLTVDQGYEDSPLILETLARSYMHHLRYQPAYACLTKWIELEPNSIKPYHWRGWVYERLDHAEQAMTDYEKVLELDPERFQVRLRIAEMLLEDKKPQDALPHLERLRTQAPDRPEVLARLGQVYFLLGRGPEARQLLEAAVATLPDDPALLLHLGKLDLQDNRPTDAERWLRSALRVDPSDTEALYTLSSAIKAQGRDADAADAFKQYERYVSILERANTLLKDEAKKHAAGPDGASEIGRLLIDIGRDQLGLFWLDQALARDPYHQPTHRALVDYYTRKGELDKAEMYRRRIRTDDQSANR